jgi:hypothetical protein
MSLTSYFIVRGYLRIGVTWDTGRAEETFRQRTCVQLLWIYALATRPRTGTGAAANYFSRTGKVKSKAKELGIEPPQDDQIRRAFEELKRVDMVGPNEKRGPFFRDDKPEYIKLTRVGKNVINEVHSREEIRRILEQEIGVEIDEDPEWWPEEYDEENAEVVMYATSPRPDDDSESFEVDVVARFSCDRCGGEIEHEYSTTYPGGAYGEYVEVECPNSDCGMEWKHLRGSVYDEIEPV